MKILVIRGGAIGDFILTLPVLVALRQLTPAPKRLEVLGYPKTANLAVAAGLADALRPLESPALTGFFVPDGVLDKDFAQYFSQFDLILSYLYDPEKVFQSNLARCTKARFIPGLHRPDETSLPPVHATDVFLRPLEALGITRADPEPKLLFPESDPVLACGTWLALHPGSGSERKNWPEDKWSTLLHLLARTTAWKFFLIGGEAEGDRLLRLAAGLPPDRVQLASGIPLVDMARRMAGSAFFIGHDSGISHLAAALGLSGIVLWGETIEEIWRPRSNRIKVLRSPHGLSHLPVEEVASQLP